VLALALRYSGGILRQKADILSDAMSGALDSWAPMPILFMEAPITRSLSRQFLNRLRLWRRAWPPSVSLCGEDGTLLPTTDEYEPARSGF